MSPSWPLESSTAMAHCPHTAAQRGQHSQAHPATPEPPASPGLGAQAPRGEDGHPQWDNPAGPQSWTGHPQGTDLLELFEGHGAGLEPGQRVAKGHLPRGQPGQGAHLHLPLSPMSPAPHLGWAVTPLPNRWYRAGGSGGVPACIQVGGGGAGPAANTWALKSHPGYGLSVGCRCGVPRGSCDTSWSPL